MIDSLGGLVSSINNSANFRGNALVAAAQRAVKALAADFGIAVIVRGQRTVRIYKRIGLALSHCVCATAIAAVAAWSDEQLHDLLRPSARRFLHAIFSADASRAWSETHAKQRRAGTTRREAHVVSALSALGSSGEPWSWFADTRLLLDTHTERGKPAGGNEQVVRIKLVKSPRQETGKFCLAKITFAGFTEFTIRA